eukprot:1421669-Rhodomonas_salina.2
MSQYRTPRSKLCHSTGLPVANYTTVPGSPSQKIPPLGHYWTPLSKHYHLPDIPLQMATPQPPSITTGHPAAYHVINPPPPGHPIANQSPLASRSRTLQIKCT